MPCRRLLSVLMLALCLAGIVGAPFAHAKDGSDSGGSGHGGDGGGGSGGGGSDDGGSHGDDSGSSSHSDDSGSGDGGGSGKSGRGSGRGQEATRTGDDAPSSSDRAGTPRLPERRRNGSWGASSPETARTAVSRGWAVPLASVLPTVATAAPGDVLEVDLVRAPGGWRYEILVLTRQGRYREVIVDARRNVVVAVRER